MGTFIQGLGGHGISFSLPISILVGLILFSLSQCDLKQSTWVRLYFFIHNGENGTTKIQTMQRHVHRDWSARAKQLAMVGAL